MAAEKPTAYLEMSIISYLAARMSRDLVTAAHQQITHEWWDTRRAIYDVYVSEFVVKESAAQNDYNIDAMYEAIRKAQDASGREIVKLRPERSIPREEAERSPGALAVADAAPEYGEKTPPEA